MSSSDHSNRINQVLEAFKISKADFSKVLGKAPTVISRSLNSKKGVPTNFLMLVLEHYPEVSAEWLIRGNGSLFRKDSTNDDNKLVNSIKVIPVNNKLNLTDLSRGDINRLPTLDDFLGNQPSNQLVFYVKDYAMEPEYRPGDMVISLKLTIDYSKGIEDGIYFFIKKSGEAQIRILSGFAPGLKTLALKGLQSEFSPIEINVNEIAAIYRPQKIIREAKRF